MQLSTLFLSAITAVVCVNAATIPSGAEANNPANNLVNPLQARSYDYVDPGIEAHLERRSPGYDLRALLMALVVVALAMDLTLDLAMASVVVALLVVASPMASVVALVVVTLEW
ncbi:hypothetical protein BASA81_012879 [Batrachochytrium salamandrivorans]|nr:hypothetical protein BASA81_012879 [Batrachochytrium salamandrivorans]